MQGMLASNEAASALRPETRVLIQRPDGPRSELHWEYQARICHSLHQQARGRSDTESTVLTALDDRGRCAYDRPVMRLRASLTSTE